MKSLEQASEDDTCPPPESADIETASAEYAARFAGGVGQYFLEVQTRLTLELLGDLPRARVLDVGGGHGQLAAPLVQHGYHVMVTGSSDSCKRGLGPLLETNSCEFRRCSMLHLPFEDRTFDVVIAFRLLAHVRRWPELIREMCRVAASVVVVDYPDRRSFNFAQQAFFEWKKSIERNTRPYRCFSRRDLTGEFETNGFGNPRFCPEFFVPMVLHRAIGHSRVSRHLETLSSRFGLTKWFGSPVILRVQRRNGTASRNSAGETQEGQDK